jgi:hypothetical protein
LANSPVSHRRAPRTVSEAAFLNRARYLHLACTEIFASEGMASHEEHEENQDSQSKIVVILTADDSREWFALQLGRRESLDAYLAKKTAASVDHLETIAINQANRSILGDEYSAMIDIPYDAACIVDYQKRASRISASAYEKSAISSLEVGAATLRAIEAMDILTA